MKAHASQLKTIAKGALRVKVVAWPKKVNATVFHAHAGKRAPGNHNSCGRKNLEASLITDLGEKVPKAFPALNFQSPGVCIVFTGLPFYSLEVS